MELLPGQLQLLALQWRESSSCCTSSKLQPDERTPLGRGRSLLREERSVLEQEHSLLGQERGPLRQGRILLLQERSLLGEEHVQLLQEHGPLRRGRISLLQERSQQQHDRSQLLRVRNPHLLALRGREALVQRNPLLLEQPRHRLAPSRQQRR